MVNLLNKHRAPARLEKLTGNIMSHIMQELLLMITYSRHIFQHEKVSLLFTAKIQCLNQLIQLQDQTSIKLLQTAQ